MIKLAVFSSAILVAGSLISSARPVNGPDFNMEVRAILSGHCFKCHGADDKLRKAGLRLDNRAGAVALLPDGRRGVVPGKSDKSELVRRILATDGRMMPPASANKPLSAAEKDILRRWVAAGAVYKPHWAFVQPRVAALPAVRFKSWPRNPIDYFVLARLEKEGLKPSPEADNYTLCRRVYLDLIGLPPTPEEADEFVKDSRPNAYERLVDKLLASPHYGERWARRWLDLARYADTNGYEKDRQRSIWPYRDWVIDALNQDMPFDLFTMAQLAGDMLPLGSSSSSSSAVQALGPTIATGFHRNTMLNEEGGIDPNEFRFYAMVDRTNTTGTAWLGLTVGCAQCHSHKFDPLTHTEYYRLMACLNNADEPTVDVFKADIAEKRKQIESQATERESKLAGKFPGGAPALDKAFNAWLYDQKLKAVAWTLLRPVSATSNMPHLTILDDNSVFSSGDMSKRDVYSLKFRTDLDKIAAIRIEAIPDDRLPNNGPGRVWYEGPFGDFLLSEITLQADGKPAKFVRATQSFGSPAQNAIDGNPQTIWRIDGGQGKAHTAVFNLAEPVAAKDLAIDLLFEWYHPTGIGRFKIWATSDPRAVAALPTDVEQILTIDNRSAEQEQRLKQYFLSVAPELKAERDEIKKLRDSKPAFSTTLVMQERPADNPRPSFLFHRGEFLQPRERVNPGIPAFLPQPGKALNRLEFARWLVNGKNPLTARVIVNRQWQAFFGKGIVTTLEDFGYTGQPPSHPDLLDWLACAFSDVSMREIGKVTPKPVQLAPGQNLIGDHYFKQVYGLEWSMKKLHRLIVTSATYRQSSKVTPLLRSRDPQNRLLTRGPRVRLEAELVRDSALSASGLLSGKIGGPSVFPPQPPGVTTEGAYGAIDWKPSPGEDRYRRGIYTFAKRTAPYAMFTTFDGPSGEACCPRRETSNTPLQALTLLNDLVFMEAAQALGRLISTRPGTVEQRVAYLFRRCVTRPPDGREIAIAVQFFDNQKSRLAADPESAKKLCGEGASGITPPSGGGGGTGDIAERAAWTALARSFLNLDETVTKR